jgi:small subunit ribosomal protein S20
VATKSAAKAHRQSLKRRLRNRMVRSAVRTYVKKAESAIVAGDPEAARLAVRTAMGSLDRAAKKGVIHANAAARRKSRLVLKFNAAVAAIQTTAEDEKPKRKAKAEKTPKAKATKAAAKGRKTKKGE